MCAMVTAQPGIAHSVTTLRKFSSAPSECHCQPLKGLTNCLQMTKSWGIEHCRPKVKFPNDLPDFDWCQEPASHPEAVGEFNVDISQPKLIGFVDASHGSELRKQKSITSCVFTLSGDATECENKTQTITASVCCCIHRCKSYQMSKVHPTRAGISTGRANRDSHWQSGCLANHQ